jgi:hypothetical protein
MGLEALVDRRIARTLAVFGMLAVAACSGSGTGGSSIPQLSPAFAGNDALLGPENGYYPMLHGPSARPLCPPQAGQVRCFAWIRTDLVAGPPATPNGIPTGIGYTPADIQAAYDLDPGKGAGQTVAIIDAEGYATAAADLSVFRKAAGLPPCTVVSHCLRILNEHGQTQPLPAQDEKWAGEQSVDLDAVSGVCPKCRIMLFEASDATPSSLTTALDTAASMGANVISNSYGSAEVSPPLPVAFQITDHVIVASAGDNGGGTRNGGGPEMPCTYNTVVCVGGTQLTHAGNKWRSTVWNSLRSAACGSKAGSCGATSSGCSRIVAKPVWQTDHGCAMRSAADVSADASVFTPYAVYNTVFKAQFGNKWEGFGGTSLSAPLVAAMFALAGNTHSRHGAMEVWKNRRYLTDVTEGNNLYAPVTGSCASAVRYICVAGPGYDGPSGLGTPNGVGAF